MCVIEPQYVSVPLSVAHSRLSCCRLRSRLMLTAALQPRIPAAVSCLLAPLALASLPDCNTTRNFKMSPLTLSFCRRGFQRSDGAVRPGQRDDSARLALFSCRSLEKLNIKTNPTLKVSACTWEGGGGARTRLAEGGEFKSRRNQFSPFLPHPQQFDTAGVRVYLLRG